VKPTEQFHRHLPRAVTLPLLPSSLSVYRSVGNDNRLITYAKDIFGLRDIVLIGAILLCSVIQ
jgi:hypothetical protein